MNDFSNLRLELLLARTSILVTYLTSPFKDSNKKFSKKLFVLFFCAKY